MCEKGISIPNIAYFRPASSGGARGVCAPPVFWGEKAKIHPKLCLFFNPIGVLHHLILATCAGPDHL